MSRARHRLVSYCLRSTAALRALPSLRNLRLRGRLVAGFLFLAALTGVSGAAGLYFVNHIGVTVGTFSEVTSPLLAESTALTESVQKARVTLLEALAGRDEAAGQEAAKKLAEFDEASRASLARLEELVRRAGFAASVEGAAAKQKEFTTRAKQILVAHKGEIAAAGAVVERFQEFERQRRDVEALLAAFATRSETLMSEREDEAKTLVQSGRASVEALDRVLDETFNESYPVVQGAYKLMRDVVQLQEIARSFVAVDDTLRLEEIEKRAQQALKTSRTLQKRLASRLKAPEQKAEVEKLGESFGNLELILASEKGLFTAHREGLSARNRMRSLKLSLAKSARAFETELDGVAAAARGLNDGARRAAAGSIVAANASIGIVVLLGIAVALAFGLAFAARLVGPITRLTGVMRRLAEGDLDVAAPARKGNDEIAEMTEALQVFKENAVRNRALEAAQREEQARKEARQVAVDRCIAEFDRAVAASLGALRSASAEMRATAASMTETAEETSRQSSAVSSAAEETSANVQTVATAADELSASVGEISRQVTHSVSIAAQAVAEAKRTDATVQGLASAAQKIGEVVAIIQGIAGQTNLLALNATIEAARAGEHGKGFAVVAGEVKALAMQTARATEEISSQIQEIQAATRDVVTVMGAIGGTIAQMSEISTAVASAMEEQNATTQEIARNTQEAARGTAEVTTNIAGVSRGAEATGEAAGHVLATADDLGEKSEALRGDVDRFLAGIRAA